MTSDKDILAQELLTSNSRIFYLSATKFIQWHKNFKLLEAINAAYDDFPDEKESSLNTVMKTKHLKMVNDQCSY